ncbi:MAG: DUF4056 domain-containing protein [Polyangiaceae bacterium]|nr:DUF4056 domain-containing protein [Polyangiaceae bacterium]
MSRSHLTASSANSTCHVLSRGGVFSRAAKALGLVTALVTTGCRGAGWNVAPEFIAPPHRVALALGDSSTDAGAFDSTKLPAFDPPTHVRPCCAFGMDLETTFQGAKVPGYRMENVTSLDSLGHHEYDNGAIALRPNERMVDLEKNGILYTCRGGFVDTAHVRDNSDMMLYVGYKIAALLPSGGAIEIPGDGAMRRIVVKAISSEEMAERGRFATAAVLAQWAVYQISIWHEMATWYGYESVPGFSEKVSTFSVEDLYSNTLGIKVGAALVEGSTLRSRDEYNHTVDAWITGVLQHLNVVPKEGARLAMRTVEGRWWDSTKILPDSKVVKRRNTAITPPLLGWRVEDAVGASGVPSELAAMCQKAGPPLALTIPDKLGALSIADLVRVEIQPEKWAVEAKFPFPKAPYPTFTSADYPSIVEAIRADLLKELGEGFDRPGPAQSTSGGQSVSSAP